MAYLLNISSNHQPKLYIGSALARLNELGDMLVSGIYQSEDRSGGKALFYNCAILLHVDSSLHALTELTKQLETELDRKKKSEMTRHIVTVDIDILAEQTHDGWRFIPRRLPLSDDVCWAVTELGVSLPNLPKHKKPALAEWQF